MLSFKFIEIGKVLKKTFTVSISKMSVEWIKAGTAILNSETIIHI